MENKEKKGKKVNFLYVNRKKIGAVIAAAALVCAGLGAKSCSDSKLEVKNNVKINHIFDDMDIPTINIKEILDEIAETNPEIAEISEDGQEQISNEKDAQESKDQNQNNENSNTNNNGGSNQPGNTGGNKPSEPSTPVEPEKPQHIHNLVSRYEAHDENETCVVTRWQVCTASNCPNAGQRFNQTTTRSSHQYTPIAEIEDPVGSGIWIITDMCTVCNHTQERSSRYSLSGYSMNSEVFEKRATEKQKTLKLY